MNQTDRIKPYEQNPAYWQYKGKPILLRGASDDDNLYQWVGKTLTDHLDLMKSVGGNFVRNTMSDRDPGNVYPFKQVGERKYDLDQWNDEYWKRLTFFLEETKKREIIPQFTLWDQHDLKLWHRIPWNPENNINYDESDLPNSKQFCNTVADQNEKVLHYQNKYIEKLMSITLEYNHVLYNINNESWAGIEWENYWAKKIKDMAAEKQMEIEVTTMHMYPSSTVRSFFEYGDLYSFVDISQVNQDSKGEKGQAHWDALMKIRNIIHTKKPVPMNNEKIYGDHEQINKKTIQYNTSAGTREEAVERFWRDIFAGCAAVRFHRPKFWGMGLCETSMKQLKALDMLIQKLNIFECSPCNELLSNRKENSAYCFANIGSQYAIYFPKAGTVDFDPWVTSDQIKLTWLQIDEGRWLDEEIIDVEWELAKNDYKINGTVTLKTPSEGSWIALIEIV